MVSVFSSSTKTLARSLHRKHSTPAGNCIDCWLCVAQKLYRNMTLKIICEESLPRLRREDRQRRAGDASRRQCVPSEMLYLRGVRCSIAERRSICHQAEPALLSAGLWEGSRNVSRIQLRWGDCVTRECSLNGRFLFYIADDYCCEDVYHTRIDGRRGPKRPRWDWEEDIH